MALIRAPRSRCANGSRYWWVLFIGGTIGHHQLVPSSLSCGLFWPPRTMNYMRTVKRCLEERRVPVFVAQAQVGQSFAELTRIGLARAKGMVAFCTSDYGAYTGAGYETFHELEYAHDNKLHIFPTRLCEEWAPAPQNNPRGTFQN